VQGVAGYLGRPESLDEGLSGVDAMFLLGGFADMPGVLARAEAAGAGHVVPLSSRSVVGGKADNAVVAMHQGSEAALREAGVGWTPLRPGPADGRTARGAAAAHIRGVGGRPRRRSRAARGLIVSARCGIRPFRGL